MSDEEEAGSGSRRNSSSLGGTGYPLCKFRYAGLAHDYPGHNLEVFFTGTARGPTIDHQLMMAWGDTGQLEASNLVG
ncbi:MAG: hypothetical protein ACREA0_14340 [bacterium]